MKKIIYDCDNTMGIEGCDVDDGLALLYLLGKRDIELCGITSTYGNSDVDTVYANTALMLKELGRSDIELVKGSANKHSLKSAAADFIVKTVTSNKGNISILATGSLTNLYGAYLLDNDIFEHVSEIVLMGGITKELRINGKILDELNLSCDPAATECVLRNGKNVSILTGNNCLDAFFTNQEFNQRLLSNDMPIAQYIAQKCEYWFKNMMTIFNIEGFHNWDVVAAAYLVNSSLFNNNVQNIIPNPKNLEKGLLSNNTPDEGLPCLINIPVIANLKTFTDDVYDAWLGLDIPYNKVTGRVDDL
ncbi:MAG TPA: nucleoside hydrolase [Desulfosporosinus sp.]|nr:nucleoside hydrolase [Desulfosporosinus sp.]